MTDAGQGSAYVKFSHPASRYAVVGAAALVSVEAARCRSARVALGGLVPYAKRARSRGAGARRQGRSMPGTMAAAAAQRAARISAGDVSGDIFASAEYRAAVAPVYVKRALAAAALRAAL